MITPFTVTRWEYRRATKRQRRAAFRFTRRALGAHDIYSRVARDPRVLAPRNAGRR